MDMWKICGALRGWRSPYRPRHRLQFSTTNAQTGLSTSIPRIENGGVVMMYLDRTIEFNPVE
jgi:hypothetical protein